jgi:hypothetical protein
MLKKAKYMKNLQVLVTAGLIFAFLAIPAASIRAQRSAQTETFEKIELLVTEGEKIREVGVRVVFGPDAMNIVADNGGMVLKTMKYSEIRTADYSYTKKPRWKTGLGLGATAFIFPPMLFIAIPLAFTKHRRHWVTIRGENDYAVLKVSKSSRKIFMPAFETHSNVRIEGLGENK